MKYEVEYLCEHLTCRMPCHTGLLVIEEQKLKDLSVDSNILTSPSRACKIGFNQQFRILSKKESLAPDEVLVAPKVLTLEERVKKLEEQVQKLLMKETKK